MGEVEQLVDACRVPATLPEGRRGLWTVRRADVGTMPAIDVFFLGLEPYRVHTTLERYTCATAHLDKGEIVMEDSPREIRRHLPILLKARGRVLVSGLGLGCVVRGLLAKPQVAHVDVIESDRHILQLIGPEFAGNPRVRLHHGDALNHWWPANTRWDYAWHDVWSEDEPLHLVHARLIKRYAARSSQQGAWQMPRLLRRPFPDLFLDGRQRKELPA